MWQSGPMKTLQDNFQGWYLRAKLTLLKVFIVSAVFVVLTWISIFMYGSFLYTYMPPVGHVKPVHLQFSTSCEKKKEIGLCSFPKANVSLVREDNDKLLMPGQPYMVYLELEMPESNVNQKLGMFMVHLHFYSSKGKVLQGADRSSMLRYRSSMLQAMDTFLFSSFYLLGTSEQKQGLRVELFNRYLENSFKPALGAIVEIQTKHIEIYSAQLVIHAHFTGLRYMLFNYPLLSALVGICSNFSFLLTIALLSWYQYMSSQHAKQVVVKVNMGKSIGERRMSVRATLDRHKSSDSTNAESSETSEVQPSAPPAIVLETLQAGDEQTTLQTRVPEAEDGSSQGSQDEDTVLVSAKDVTLLQGSEQEGTELRQRKETSS